MECRLEHLKAQVDDAMSEITRESYPFLYAALDEASNHLGVTASGERTAISPSVLARVVGEISSVKYFGAAEMSFARLKASLSAALLELVAKPAGAG